MTTHRIVIDAGFDGERVNNGETDFVDRRFTRQDV